MLSNFESFHFKLFYSSWFVIELLNFKSDQVRVKFYKPILCTGQRMRFSGDL